MEGSVKPEHSRLRQPAKSGFSDSLSAATGEHRYRDQEEVTEQVFGSEEGSQLCIHVVMCREELLAIDGLAAIHSPEIRLDGGVRRVSSRRIELIHDDLLSEVVENRAAIVRKRS